MTEVIIENIAEQIEIQDEIKETIELCIEKSLEYEGCDFDAQVSVTICDNEEIHRINKEQRDIDRPTDVLSFPMLFFDENGDIIDSDYDMDGEFVILGDIVISAERAMEQAEEYGHSFRREIAFLTVHSMLHLLGYDHVTSEEDEKVMFARQEEILNKIGITREV